LLLSLWKSGAIVATEVARRLKNAAGESHSSQKRRAWCCQSRNSLGEIVV
jgi:hypothetical protein